MKIIPKVKTSKNNNIVLDKQKIIFLLIAKNANSSVKVSLWRALGKEIVFRGSIFPSGLHNRDTLDYKTIEEIGANLSNYTDYIKISFVRNPWDRIVSVWSDMTKKRTHPIYKDYYGCYQGMPFNEFVELIVSIPEDNMDLHILPQYDSLFYNDVQIPDFIGRFENLKSDWKEVQTKLKHTLDLPDLEVWHKTDHLDYRSVYDDISKQLIENRYRKDIETFKYKF